MSTPSDLGKRSQAILQLQPGASTDDLAITTLVKLLCTDQDLNLVEDATWVLVRYGKAAIPALLNELTQDNPRVRHNIAHALGKIADGQALPALLTATHDTDPSVRLKAVYALGQLGDSQAIDALIVRLDDPVQDVRWTAREVLQGFGKKALQSESAQVRELVANLLGDSADKSAVDPLIAALETEEWQVRFAIIEALGNLGDRRALSIIHQMVNDPHPSVRAMANAVAKMF